MNSASWPVRLYTLDVSRGLAALSVVLWHWEHFTYDGPVKPADYSPVTQPLYHWLKPFYERGHSGVQYFFLLSGFVFFWLYRDSIQKRATSAYEFAVQRFSRLYPLHLVTLVLVALLQGLYVSREQTFFVYPNNDPFHFLLHLGFASNWGLEKGLSFNGPVWSVSVEILLYLLFFLVALLGRGGAAFCVATSMLASALYVVTDHGVFTGAAMFFLGGFVYHATVWITARHPRLAPVVGGIAVAMWMGVLVHFYGFDLSHLVSSAKVPERILAIGFQYYLLFPLTICALALLGIHRDGFMKSIAWIGDITYSSYLVHFPLQLILGLAVSYGVLGREFYKSPVSLIAFFAFLVPASFWVYRKFELPMQNWIRRTWAASGVRDRHRNEGNGARNAP